ncbi:MAG: hypothetical protein JWM66_1565 [Solirubrobacterales bacterium]|nr:hypothetical protein [Solirubrobacterales bacterium]
MDSNGHARGAAAWERLLRRAHIVVEHHRYRGQPIDVRDVVERVLATSPFVGKEVLRYRALLQEAVASLIRGLR